MANTVQTYLDLITSAHQSQPNFVATVAQSVGMSVQMQSLLSGIMGPLFDLNTPPVGDQLNIIGELVGASREVIIPIAQVAFAWDDSSLPLGWDAGSWAANPSASYVITLPDDTYLILINAKILANNWNGTTTEAYEIYNEVFAPFTILIQDNCNMSYDIAIIGGVIPALTLALLTGGYVPLKPEGIRLTDYYSSTGTGPAFAWDLDTAYCQGWDTGNWLQKTFNTNIPS